MPVDQQPVVEMQQLRAQPFYDWADTSESYQGKLGDLWKFTMLFISLPVSYATFSVLPYEFPQLFLAANIGTLTAMLPFVVRLRVGWGFVSERLREKETYYEAQQRGLFARKDKEVRRRGMRAAAVCGRGGPFGAVRHEGGHPPPAPLSAAEVA